MVKSDGEKTRIYIVKQLIIQMEVTWKSLELSSVLVYWAGQLLECMENKLFLQL